MGPPTETEKARALLERAGPIAVVSHERPDGDAVGSVLGLTLALRRRGQPATAVLEGGLAARYDFLPGAAEVVPSIPSEAEVLVAVDCADWTRTGFAARDLRRPAGLNIDHHPTNSRYAEVNLIDPQAVATTQILYRLSGALGLPVDRDVAVNYLAGLVTDTIGFRTPNVTPEVLRLAADLEGQAGALATLYERLLNQRSFPAARYWGAGLASLERSGPLAYARLSLEDRLAAGYTANDDADLINLLATIEGFRAYLVFVEQGGGQVKVSWRSPQFDVARVAQRFGGGGHAAAAGASVAGNLDEVVARVIETTRRAIEAGGDGA